MDAEGETKTPEDFAERLAAATPTPGGGAAAARVGLYACSLVRMVTGITLEKMARAGLGLAPATGDLEAAAREILAARDEARRLGGRFRNLEKEDMAAFQAYLDALKLPRGTPEEKERRQKARVEAAARATDSPLATLEAARDVLRLAKKLLELSRKAPLRAESDLGAAVELSSAAFRAAELNVRANLRELAPEKVTEVQKTWSTLAAEAGALYEELRSAFAGGKV